MILDAAICTIHRVDGTERSANSPTDGLPQIYRNWCGRLGHESGDGSARVARIRIHDAEVRQHDIAEYSGAHWVITRVYHGQDDDTGQPVADLTMETAENLFARLTLIATAPQDPPTNERGFENEPVESARPVWSMIREIAHSEYTGEGARGIRAQIKCDVYDAEYRGELLAELDGNRYTVERTETPGGGLITLRLDNAAKGGAADGKV